ncbi:hypothetical protein [Janibacter sp. G56]|uniref:hypothetical protein n=1 Tax=Janibacter sp. G56 TaxID=3418717 RepID=UPI003D04B91A
MSPSPATRRPPLRQRALAVALAVGGVALLIKPGVLLIKLLGLILLAYGIIGLTRRYRFDTTVVAVLLLVAAAYFALVALGPALGWDIPYGPLDVRGG